MRSVTLHTCLSEPTTKIWMKIDPYYQRQKCSPAQGSLEIKFMRIFAGLRWRAGFKWEWGRRKWRFSLISPAISSKSSRLRPQLLYRAMYSLSGTSVTPRQMTLNGHFALKSVSGSAMALGQNCSKIWRATYTLSATNCSPGILVSSNVRFM